MINRKSLFAIALLAALPLAASAQTCSNPIELMPGQTVNVDTSSASDIVGSVAGLPAPGPDVVYSFVANGVSASETITIGSPDFDWGVNLTTACAQSIGLGDFVNGTSGSSGSGGSFPLADGGGNALTDGTTYYVIVSGNPTASGSPSGTMELGTPDPLPVKLQSFSAD